MYGIGEIIDFLETKKVPKQWAEDLDWDKTRFVSVAMGVLQSFESDFWLPKNKPFKTPHIHKLERRRRLIRCIPELNKVMVFEKNTYSFIDGIDQKEIHQWVKENSPLPRLFTSFRNKRSL